DEADQKALENLGFRRLPPYRNWPTQDDIEAARLALPRLEDRRSKRRLLIGKEDIPTAKPRRRLEYRKTFTVSRSGDVRGEDSGGGCRLTALNGRRAHV